MARRDPSPMSTTSQDSHSTAHTNKQDGLRRSSTASPPTSTPPTSLGDEASILSEAVKLEQVVDMLHEVSTVVTTAGPSTALQIIEDTSTSESRRPARSSRKAVTTYNVQILAGTAVHTPTKYLDKHHRNVLHGPLEEVLQKPMATPRKRVRSALGPNEHDDLDPSEQQLVIESAHAAQRSASRLTDLRREVLLNSKSLVNSKSLGSRTLKRSASDPLFRPTKKISRTSSLKRTRAYVEANTDDETEEEDEAEEPDDFVQRKTKKWLAQGLFVGQHREFDARLSESRNRTRRKSRLVKERNILPLPMFAAEKLLNEDPRLCHRDFKLPFDTYNPLDRRVKVDNWVKISKNRFIGEASALWKHDKQDNSQCYCSVEDGCGEACHNRIMAYECDETNCPLTAEQCKNRPFAQLKKRAKGNRYDYGVEVMETSDKGYGVRAMRSFEPHQIIVEYAGEIITQQECESRMKKQYKKDKCYYLMSFDNKMIIDATRGTIARFVNHSCEPNCEMIKWTVRGQPRMALFAGRRGIMTGEELTYDYNFDPFSMKNIQKCHCGTKSCRGVLGPKLKKPIQEEKPLTKFIAGTKRKIRQVLGLSRKSVSASPSPKKHLVENSVSTRARNAQAQAEADRAQANKEAFEHAAQLASRENRAANRHRLESSSESTPAPISTPKSKKAARKTRTVLRSSRRNAFELKRKVPKVGALKPVMRQTTVIRKTAKQPVSRRTYTRKVTNIPVRAVTPGWSDSEVEEEEVSEAEEDDTSEEMSEDERPAITSASLRSATKRLAQDSLDISPIPSLLPRPNSKEICVANIAPAKEKGKMTSYFSRKLNTKVKGNSPAPRSIHKTGAGVTRVSQRVRKPSKLLLESA